MKGPNVLGGICTYSAVVTVVIKVIIGNSTQCRGVSATTVITDDNYHQGREERKSGEDTYTQQMNLFVLYSSTKGSYTKQPLHLISQMFLKRLGDFEAWCVAEAKDRKTEKNVVLEKDSGYCTEFLRASNQHVLFN